MHVIEPRRDARRSAGLYRQIRVDTPPLPPAPREVRIQLAGSTGSPGAELSGNGMAEEVSVVPKSEKGLIERILRIIETVIGILDRTL